MNFCLLSSTHVNCVVESNVVIIPEEKEMKKMRERECVRGGESVCVRERDKERERKNESKWSL